MVYINGEWRESSNKLEVRNPATNEVLETISIVGKKETEDAIGSATKAYKDWKKTTASERVEYLKKVSSLLEDMSEEIAQTITKENGKPIKDARMEVKDGIEFIDWYVEEAKRVYGDIIPASHRGKQLLVLKEPVGVCAAITPWNFPFSMITRKIAPAIAAGCTVILKPASATPLSAIKVFECFHKAGIPQGVVNLVIGSSKELGNVLTKSKDVRKLTFTGSTAVGKQLMKDSADTVKNISMELGGHAPYIVFADADIDLAIQGVLGSKFTNSGQTCISTNRIFVEKSIAEDFSQKLAKEVKKLKVGNGLNEETNVGPLIDQASMSKIMNQIDDAKQKEGKIICGGIKKEDNNGGYFIEPTVIENANDQMLIAHEETFGPIAPIFTFETEEELIKRANHDNYGLAGYCYTKDLSRSIKMMNELEYGILGINDAAPTVIQAPFGGVKESGIGNEGGKYGIEEYLVEKFVSVNGNA